MKLPAPPRKWGPQQRDLGLSGFSPAIIDHLRVAPTTFRPSSSTWKNSGSVDISVRVGDLRPEATFTTNDKDSMLGIFGERRGSVRGTWRATVRGYDEVFTDEVMTEVCEPRDLTQAMRLYLGLDGEEIQP